MKITHGWICVLVAFTASVSYAQPFRGDPGCQPALQGGVGTASATRTADWPRWRGPNADGVADGQIFAYLLNSGVGLTVR